MARSDPGGVGGGVRTAVANLRRLGWIFRVLAAHLAAHLLGARLAAWPALARRFPPVGLAAPERARAVLEDLGGTFIKLGQMLALQPDILPFEYCAALSSLLDRVAPFGYAAVERTFREELGRGPDELFDAFETTPIATASIGQVHVAWLEGHKLAVKVQRPNVPTDFAGDVRLMESLVRAIRRLRVKPLYWLIEPLSEFAAWTVEELDYRKEARYMEQLRANSRDNPAERVPTVLWAYTTRRTLVLEFFEGMTLLGYLRAREAGDEVQLYRLERSGFVPALFARNIIDNFLGDAFRHGMFHADLHPANLMILKDNVVGYVDFGITGILSHYSRRHLVRLTLAYTRGDLDGMCAAFFKVSALDAGSDPQEFRDRLGRLADSWYGPQGSERQLRKNFTLVMVDMLHLSRATGIWPERDVIKYIRSAIAIDGLITRFAPGFDVGSYLAAVCDRALRQEAWQLLVSYDRLVEWAAATGSLAHDGGQRGAELLDRATRPPLPPLPGRPAGRAAAADGGEAGAGALRLASLACAGALLVGATAPRAAVFGANLFTAEVLVVAAALTLSLSTLRRCR